ncbi:MAG: pyridoxamine 5'-phosphate oxidase family protein [Myxococcota bacterium]
MGKVFDGIDARNAGFIRKQHVFFVATAPRADEGLVNLSPKGLEGLAILDEHTVAYLDLMGSGIETVAHVRENGRIVLMFCAFEGPPRILRLHGRGEVIEPGDADWDALYAHFGDYRNARTILRVKVDRVSDSCGYGVPEYSYVGDRRQLHLWTDRHDDATLEKYAREFNAKSLDGLPGLRGGS